MSRAVDISDEDLSEKGEKELESWLKEKGFVNHTFNRFEVIGFSNEAKTSKNKCVLASEIVHAAIIFYDSKNYGYTFEWGNKTDSIDFPDYDENIPYYRHDSNSWFGCEIGKGKLKNIKLKDIFYHGVLWKEKIGKGGQYPRNCRGYVDSVLEFLGKKRIWMK